MKLHWLNLINKATSFKRYKILQSYKMFPASRCYVADKHIQVKHQIAICLRKTLLPKQHCLKNKRPALQSSPTFGGEVPISSVHRADTHHNQQQVQHLVHHHH